MGKAIPAKFDFVRQLGDLPNHMDEALTHYGLMEHPGKANNPDITKWATELKIQVVYTADSIPWCGLFVAICLYRAGWKTVEYILWARNWLNFGRPVQYWLPMDHAGIGDLVIFSRGDGGHVAFFIAFSPDMKYVLVFGGNQSDAVTFAWMDASRILGIRRCIWRLSQPAAVYKIIYVKKKSGELVSRDEQ